MAEIVVNLRLATNQIRQQASQAAGQIRNSVGGGRRGGGGGGGGGSGGGGGGAGLGGAAAFGGFVAGTVQGLIQQLSAMIRSLVQAIKNAIISAFRDAAGRYAKQLSSGLPGGFLTHRASLAEVIGVSERDVLRFAGATEYLSNSLKFSTKALNETTRNLTSATWAVRVFYKDLQALVALFAVNFASDIRKALFAVHRVVEDFGRFFAKALAYAMRLAIGIALQQILPAGGQALAKFGFGQLPDKGAAGTPTTDYQRLQSSPWERMGLVIGTGTMGNPLKATERNTRNAVVELKKLVGIVAPRAGGGPRLTPQPQNMP